MRILLMPKGLTMVSIICFKSISCALKIGQEQSNRMPASSRPEMVSVFCPLAVVVLTRSMRPLNTVSSPTRTSTVSPGCTASGLASTGRPSVT